MIRLRQGMSHRRHHLSPSSRYFFKPRHVPSIFTPRSNSSVFLNLLPPPFFPSYSFRSLSLLSRVDSRLSIASSIYRGLSFHTLLLLIGAKDVCRSPSLIESPFRIPWKEYHRSFFCPILRSLSPSTLLDHHGRVRFTHWRCGYLRSCCFSCPHGLQFIWV